MKVSARSGPPRPRYAEKPTNPNPHRSDLVINFLRSRVAAIVAMIMLVLAASCTIVYGRVWADVMASHLSSLRLAGLMIVVAFCLTWLLTPLAIKAAFGLKILDVPDARKIHSTPTPLLGGAAIFVALVATLSLGPGMSNQMVAILTGSGLILLMGIIDDARGLSAVVRLVGQILAVCIVMSQGTIISFLPDTAWGKAGEVLLTVGWVVGITNALNFLDGMDGLATGLAAISAAALFCITEQTREIELMLGCAAIFGACMGFLCFNFKPAIIFLGDGGSTCLGFFLASMAVTHTCAERDPVIALSTPMLILSIIIYDIIFITVARVYSGVVSNVREWIEYVGRDHLHHRLHHLGLSHKQTVLFIWLLSSFMCISAIMLVTHITVDKYLLILQALIMLTIITILMELGRNSKEEEPKPAETEPTEPGEHGEAEQRDE